MIKKVLLVGLLTIAFGMPFDGFLQFSNALRTIYWIFLQTTLDHSLVCQTELLHDLAQSKDVGGGTKQFGLGGLLLRSAIIPGKAQVV